MIGPPLKTERTSRGIRALEPDDLPAVVDLYQRVMRNDGKKAPSGLLGAFREVLLGSPWFDADLPSLVLDDRDGIAGFLGVHPRPMRLGGPEFETNRAPARRLKRTAQ